MVAIKHYLHRLGIMADITMVVAFLALLELESRLANQRMKRNRKWDTV